MIKYERCMTQTKNCDTVPLSTFTAFRPEHIWTIYFVKNVMYSIKYGMC